MVKKWEAERYCHMSDKWLHAAINVVDYVPEYSQDVIRVINKYVWTADRDEVDIVAQLVGLCYRTNESGLGSRVYNLYRCRFEEIKSTMCIIASVWVEEVIPNAGKEALEAIRECEVRNRLKLGQLIYSSYSSDCELIKQYKR